MDKNKLYCNFSLIYTWLGFPLLANMSLTLFYVLCNKNDLTWIHFPAYLFSFLLVGLINAILLCVFNKPLVSSIIVSTAMFALGYAQQVKIALSHNPVYFADIFFFKSDNTVMDILSESSLWEITKNFLTETVAFFVILSAITVCSAFLKVEKQTLKPRLIAIGAGLVCLLMIYAPNGAINKLTLNIFFNGKVRSDCYTTGTLEYTSKYGVLSGMTSQLLESRMYQPDGYDKEQVEKILAEAEKNSPDRSWGSPNIIMVFSESFWDITKLDELEYNTDPLKNYHALKNKGISFNMISPTFGGMSANVEFEILTSSSMSMYSQGYVPYMQLFQSTDAANIPSAVMELKSEGYDTTLISTWSKELFDCKTAYKYIGFDKTLYDFNLSDAEYSGTRISDNYVAEKIIKEFESSPEGKKHFIMALTAEGHMPYKADKYDNYDISVKKSPNLNIEGAEGVFLSYGQGLISADKMLQKLYDYINTLSEHTILVFYGDHLPFLQYNGESITDRLSYFNTEDERLNLFRRYNTEGLILANFDLGYDNIDYLGGDLLMPYIFGKTNFDVSDYYKWLNTTIDSLPAMNFAVSADKKGCLYYTNSLPEDIEETKKKREYVNYYYFSGK